MSKEYIRDELSGLEYVSLEPEDTFSFECTRCGNCCRNVIDAVLVESLDAFRLARHLKQPIAEFIDTYTEMRLLTSNFPMLFLKTKPESGDVGECIFLKNGSCSVQSAKPRTCRMYPLSAGPDNNGGLEYLWVAKQHHQYSPGAVKVSEWMNDALSKEDRDFLLMEYRFIKESGIFITHLPERFNDDVLRHELIFRYFAFDPTEGFLAQYEDNMKSLLALLKRLALEAQSGAER